MAYTLEKERSHMWRTHMDKGLESGPAALEGISRGRNAAKQVIVVACE